MPWQAVLEIAVAVLITYVLLLAALAIYAKRHPDVVSLADALRFGPDVLRLIRRLAADRAVPGHARMLLGGLALYLVLPIDLVPDVLPVIGYADDIVLIAVVLRAVVRSAGPDSLERHWPGSDGGLGVVRALAGLGGPDAGVTGRNTA